jgi:hypothetical protein
MDKKAVIHAKNIIGLILFIIVIIFLVLLTKNKGSLAAVWQDIAGIFGK